MVPGMDWLMEGTNYTQFYYNFEIAAGSIKENRMERYSMTAIFINFSKVPARLWR